MCKDKMRLLLKANNFINMDDWHMSYHRVVNNIVDGVYVSSCVVQKDKVRLKATEVRFSEKGLETIPTSFYFYYSQWNASEEENLFLDMQSTNIISKVLFLELIKPHKDSFNEY